MTEELNDFICSKCGHIFVGHKNLFGKICPYCGMFTKPEEYEFPIVSDNKEKEKGLLKKLRIYLLRKLY